jgi:hypothetical protein
MGAGIIIGTAGAEGMWNVAGVGMCGGFGAENRSPANAGRSHPATNNPAAAARSAAANQRETAIGSPLSGAIFPDPSMLIAMLLAMQHPTTTFREDFDKTRHSQNCNFFVDARGRLVSR